jgi:electron transfer flavoprotein alpha subunit
MSPGTILQAGQPPEILVFVDLPAGELDDAGRGILAEASRLAKTLGGAWSALCFAGARADALSAMAPYGVDKITLIEGPAGLADSLGQQSQLLAAVIREQGAALLLLPHHDLGETLAPLLAAQLDAALFTEAIAYRLDEKVLTLTRHVLGAQVAENQTWSGGTPLVLTINPRILSPVVLPGVQPGQARTESWQSSAPLPSGTTRIVERIPADPQTVDVAEAEVMISAGLGCDSKGFAQVQELTRLLNASLGATRPAYDLGYTDFERMVGQTGKTVAPRFYLALGISGSMHHLGGIKDSKRVVAVNIDSRAPIFPNSDEGYVADLREVLPLLLQRVKSITGGAA